MYDCYDVHPPVTIISKILHFRFIQLMMYIVFIIDHIHHLMNESKIQSFAYNSDRRVYQITICREKEPSLINFQAKLTTSLNRQFSFKSTKLATVLLIVPFRL
jgi:uncharacterized membrane protein YkgB